MDEPFSQIRLNNGNVFNVDAQGYILDNDGNRMINRKTNQYYRADSTIAAGNADWVKPEMEGMRGGDPLAASSTDQTVVQKSPSQEDGGITLHDVASTIAPASTAVHDLVGSELNGYQLLRVPAAAADVALNAFPATRATTKVGTKFRAGLDMVATPLNKGTVLLESAGTKVPKVGETIFKSNAMPNSILGKGIDKLGNTFTYGRQQALEKIEALETKADILAQKKFENEKTIGQLSRKRDDVSSAKASELRTENRSLNREIKGIEADIKTAEGKIPHKLSSDPGINTREAFNRAVVFNGLRLPTNEGGRNIAAVGLEAGMENIVIPVADMLDRAKRPMEKRNGRIITADTLKIRPEDKISALVDSTVYRNKGGK